MGGFQVVHRGICHWDIYEEGKRTHKIRGVPGDIFIIWEGRTLTFNTVGAAMAYITDKLMFEMVTAESLVKFGG